MATENFWIIQRDKEATMHKTGHYSNLLKYPFVLCFVYIRLLYKKIVSCETHLTFYNPAIIYIIYIYLCITLKEFLHFNNQQLEISLNQILINTSIIYLNNLYISCHISNQIVFIYNNNKKKREIQFTQFNNNNKVHIIIVMKFQM